MSRINSDRVSLFTVATGPRGSCKTLLMSGKVCERLLKSYLLKMLKGKESKVWTNYPVGFNLYSPIENKIIHLESEPLNMEAFYTFDEEMSNGWVFIDEIDQWYDRQDWQAVTQKLLNSIMTQIRKKKLNFMATVQNFNWINARAQFQVDITIGCREAAFTPFGRRMGLDLGEMAFTSWRDTSGVSTGYQYEETKREYKKMFHGRRFWDTFDTNYQFNPLESKTKYKLKLPTKVIQIGSKAQMLPDDVDGIGAYKSEKKDFDEVLMADIMQELRNEGKVEVDRYDLRRLAKSRGIHRNSQYYIEKYMANLGAEKDGSKFVLV